VLLVGSRIKSGTENRNMDTAYCVCMLLQYSLFLVCVVLTEISVGLLTTALKQQVRSRHYASTSRYHPVA